MGEIIPVSDDFIDWTHASLSLHFSYNHLLKSINSSSNSPKFFPMPAPAGLTSISSIGKSMGLWSWILPPFNPSFLPHNTKVNVFDINQIISLAPVLKHLLMTSCCLNSSPWPETCQNLVSGLHLVSEPSSHAAFFSVFQRCQACSCLRAFALAVPSA